MDQDKFSVKQLRPFRKRLSQWTGQKINQWIEPQTGPATPSSNEPHSHGSAAPLVTTSGEYHEAATSDHFRLQFHVSDTS
jgi:hypothetical protein